MRHSTALRGCRSRISLGANVVEKQKQEGRIEPYTHPAAGWGALKYVAINLLKEKVSGGNYRTLFGQNQPDGFDCPGCAWPDREHASTFEFCENGVKAVAAESTSNRVPREQRSRVPVPVVRAYLRHQQLPRLLEHVPRSHEPGFAGDRGRGQGNRDARGFRTCGHPAALRPESRNEPSADAGRTARVRETGRDDRLDQPAA